MLSFPRLIFRNLRYECVADHVDAVQTQHPAREWEFFAKQLHTGIVGAEALDAHATPLGVIGDDLHAGPSNTYSPISAIAMPTKQAIANSRIG